MDKKKKKKKKKQQTTDKSIFKNHSTEITRVS